MLFNKI